MTPPILLVSGIPIMIAMIIVVGIVLRIFRAVNKVRNDNNTSQTYTPPPQQQGQHSSYDQNNPAANPFGNYSQPGHHQPNANYPPPDPNIPQYQQQNYTPPNYNRPAPTLQRRSTVIPGSTQYSTYMPDQPENKNRAALIIIFIAVVIVLFAAAGLFIFQRSQAGNNFVLSDFYLAYENPTEESFMIVLDDWDTIQVDAYAASANLSYTYDADRDTFHWKILSYGGDVVADTFVLREEMEAWVSDHYGDNYEAPVVLFNPSRTTFIYWTVWYDNAGEEKEIVIGDSTYTIDAHVVNDAIIFDDRNPDWSTAIEDVSGDYSLSEGQQFLVNIRDFQVLYERTMKGNKAASVFDNYALALIQLYGEAYEYAGADGNRSYEEDDKLSTFFNYIPDVNGTTVPRDFVDAINYLEAEPALFRDASPKKYDAIMDSSEVILKHAYAEAPRMASYQEMKYVYYYISYNGFFNDILKREISYTQVRDGSGELSY